MTYEDQPVYVINKDYKYDTDRFNKAIGVSKTFMSNYEQLQFPIIDEHRFEYWNSEGYYMAQRTNKFSEKQFISEASLKGGQASRNARRIFQLEMNEEKRVQYMFEAVRKKFATNTYLAKKLLDTGEDEIIEKNWWNDTLFGVNDKTLKGANILGKQLMTIREVLKTNPKLL